VTVELKGRSHGLRSVAVRSGEDWRDNVNAVTVLNEFDLSVRSVADPGAVSPYSVNRP